MFKDNPFIFIPYFQAAGFGNFKKQVGKVDTAVTRLKKLGKPRNNSDHKVFYNNQQKKKRALQDTKTMVADMLVTQNYLTGSETVSIDNPTLDQAIEQLGTLAATTAGSTLVRNISSTVETLVTGLRTFIKEFEDNGFNLKQLNAEISSQIGEDDLKLDEKATAELEKSKELYNERVRYIKSNTNEGSVQRTRQMKDARHRLGLRSAMTFKKIALTYKLAGLVQGDQTGGRTISNEDFHQVYNALWSGGEIGNRAVLADLSNDLNLRIQKEQSYDLLYEMQGTGVNSTIENAIDSIFDDKRKEFYTRTGNNAINAQTFSTIREGGQKSIANYIISGQVKKEAIKFSEIKPDSINKKLIDKVNVQSIEDFCLLVHSVSIAANGEVEKFDTQRDYNSAVFEIIKNSYIIYDNNSSIEDDGKFNIERLNKLVDDLKFNNVKQGTKSRDSFFIKNYLKELLKKVKI
jgi:nucleoside diphosphate kinase